MIFSKFGTWKKIQILINKLGLILGIFLSTHPPQLNAKAFTIDPINCTACSGLLAPLENIANSVASSFETQINNTIPDPAVSQTGFLKAMANANTAANHGSIADYSSNIDLFMVGAGAGAGLNTGANSLGDLLSGAVNLSPSLSSFPEVGFSLLPSINFGFSLSRFTKIPGWRFFDPKRVNFYFSFLSVSLPDTLMSGLSGGASNLAFALQYRLLPTKEVAAGLLKWGGIMLTAGFNKGGMNLNYNITYADSINQSNSIDTGLPSPSTIPYVLGLNLNATGAIGVQIDTFTIPLEVSTNARVGYAFSLYGGIGLDISGGSAATVAKIVSDITGKYTPDATLANTIDPTGAIRNGTDTSTASQTIKPIISNSDLFTTKGTLDLSHSEAPIAMDYRIFAGLQFNLTAFRLLMGLHKSLQSGSLAANAAARIAW